MTNNQRTAGDERRAWALIEHHANADYDGLDAALRWAADTGRVGELIITVLSAMEQLTARFSELLDRLPDDMAPVVIADDLGEDDLRRAAELIDAHRARDGATVKRIVFEKPSVTALLVGVLSLYSVLEPVTRTPAARDAIRRAALRAAELEAIEGE
jgi:hypothetical protein